MILIVDGNYLLYTLAFSLHKINLLPDLEEKLESKMKLLSLEYPYSKIYLVSDKGSSWRKKIYPEYKATRKDKRDSSGLPFEFVFETYENFKKNTKYTVLEGDTLEGDDWIWFLTKKHETENIHIFCSDSDIHQLIDFNEKRIVFCSKLERISYLPNNYEIFLESYLKDNVSYELFEDDENKLPSEEFRSLIKYFYKLEKTDKIVNIANDDILFTKIISGDKQSDNIDAVYPKVGKVTAEKVYKEYKELNTDTEINEKLLADIILEKKKLKFKEKNIIEKNIIRNNVLVNLNKIPNVLYKQMLTIYEKETTH